MGWGVAFLKKKKKRRLVQPLTQGEKSLNTTGCLKVERERGWARAGAKGGGGGGGIQKVFHSRNKTLVQTTGCRMTERKCTVVHQAQFWRFVWIPYPPPPPSPFSLSPFVSLLCVLVGGGGGAQPLSLPPPPYSFLPISLNLRWSSSLGYGPSNARAHSAKSRIQAAQT